MRINFLNIFFIFFILISNTHKTFAQQLSDLGVKVDDSINNEYTSKMDIERSQKLEWHKRFGHLTMGLALATAISGIVGTHQVDESRKKRGGIKSGDDVKKLHLHMFLAGSTLISYTAGAYYALSAPKPIGFEDENKRIWHKRLAWIHGGAFALAPILGTLAFKDYHDGKDPEGIAKLHRPVAWIALSALTAAFATMTFEF